MVNRTKYGVYSVVSDDRGNNVWVEIGYATQHADGRGFDLTLRALPLERKLVLRETSLGVAERDTSSLSLAYQVREFERAAINQCLLETGGNIGAAMERLKIPRRTLNEKMARLGIDRQLLASPLGPNKAGDAQRIPQGADCEQDAALIK
jgi:Bacterial regulatory protein, Fis family